MSIQNSTAGRPRLRRAAGLALIFIGALLIALVPVAILGNWSYSAVDVLQHVALLLVISLYVLCTIIFRSEVEGYRRGEQRILGLLIGLILAGVVVVLSIVLGSFLGRYVFNLCFTGFFGVGSMLVGYECFRGRALLLGYRS